MGDCLLSLDTSDLRQSIDAVTKRTMRMDMT